MTEKITPEVVAQHGLTQGEADEVKRHLGREPNLTELGVFSVMERALLAQVLAGPPEDVPDDGPPRHPGPGRERRRGRSGTGSPPRSRWRATTTRATSSRTRARRPAWAASSATCSRWAPARSPRRTRLLRRPSHPGPPTCSRASAGIGGYGNLHGRADRGRRGDVPPELQRELPRERVHARHPPRGQDLPRHGGGRRQPRSCTSARRPAATESTARRWPPPSSTPPPRRSARRQVGDPFMEKLLLEACLELFKTDAVVGIQDMGAAGFTSSSVEMAGRAGNGLDLFLDQVPLREEGMTSYEILLSESASACSSWPPRARRTSSGRSARSGTSTGPSSGA